MPREGLCLLGHDVNGPREGPRTIEASTAGGEDLYVVYSLWPHREIQVVMPRLRIGKIHTVEQEENLVESAPTHREVGLYPVDAPGAYIQLGYGSQQVGQGEYRGEL